MDVLRAAELDLPNPGLEGLYSNGVANGWRNFPIRGTVRGSFTESAVAHTGEKSQQMEVHELMSAWLQCSAPIRGGIVAGRDYEASIWLKADRTLDFSALVVHDNNSWFPHVYAETTLPLGHRWTQVTLRFRAARTDEKAHLGVVLWQEGKLWVDDAAIRELPSSQRPAEVRGNLVRNGSFEAGLADWVAHWTAARTVNDPQAPHGQSVVELPGGGPGRELQSAAIIAPWGRKYTLSLWLRASSPVPVPVRLRQGKQVIAGQEFSVAKSWQRFTLSVNMPPLPDGFCHLAIAPGGASVFVDAVQLETGETAGPFAPWRTLEAGLEFDSAVLTGGEVPTGRILLNNTTGQAQQMDLTLRVCDAWDRKVFSRPLAVQATPGRTETPFSVPSLGTGAFRAEIVSSRGLAYAEKAFAILPPLPTDRSTMVAMGGQVDYGGAAFMARAGSTWTKTWLLNWSSIEPQSGQWNFPRDEAVERWLKQGLKVLPVLSEAPRRLQQRPTNGALDWGWYPVADEAAMTEYARRVAEHYAGKIDTWSLQNEPDHALHPPKGEKSAVWYAREALALAKGVRKAQPKAHILLGGGVTAAVDQDQWLADILADQPHLMQLCDGFAYHNYSQDPAVTRRIVGRIRARMKELGWERPLWDAEWNPTDSIASVYQRSPRHLSMRQMSAYRAAGMLVAGLVTRLGEGLEGTIIYNAFGPGSMAESSFDLYHEADGAPRPAMVAQAVLAGYLANTQRVGPMELPGLWAYRFRRHDGKALIIAWAKDTQPEPVTVTVAGSWRLADMMGADLGPLRAETKLNAVPVYFVEVDR